MVLRVCVLFLACEVVCIDVSRYDLRFNEYPAPERQGAPYFNIAQTSFFRCCIDV